MPDGARVSFFWRECLAKENSEEARPLPSSPPLFFQWESMGEVAPSPVGFFCAVVEKSKEKLSNDP